MPDDNIMEGLARYLDIRAQQRQDETGIHRRLRTRRTRQSPSLLKENPMRYLPGERVALIRTDDPHTDLRPGDEGTVVCHHEPIDTVDVDWDGGSHLSMCLDAGDRIRRLPACPGRCDTADGRTR